LPPRGKLHAALAWIHDFCSSDERLVVFAHHREIQRAPAPSAFRTPLHSHRPRTAASPAIGRLRAFSGARQRREQAIVAVEVAGRHHSWTRFSNVAFLELDWTPAKHDQAEDRCHRFGQLDTVNATYLLAAGTVDETIATLWSASAR